MTSILYPACAIVSLVALAYRLPDLRRRREFGLVALCAYFVLSACTFLLSTPSIWTNVDAKLGVPNLAGMLAQCGAVSIAMSEQAVVLAWRDPWRKARRQILLRTGALIAILTAMAVLYGLSVPAMVDNPVDFAVNSAHIPTYAAYLAVYLFGFIVGSIEAARLSWRYSYLARRGWLRLGLRIAATGSALGLVYAAARAADIVAGLTHSSGIGWEVVAEFGAGIGDLALLVGWTIPTWGPSLSRWVSGMRDHRTYRRLVPLWRAMCDVVPAVALDPPTPRRGRGLPDLEYRLYRMVIEIRDARLALDRFIDRDEIGAVRARATARRLTGVRLDAAVEAATIVLAIRRQQANDVPATDSTENAGQREGQAIHQRDDSSDLRAEREWLVRVADAFQRSRVVAAVAGNGTARVSATAGSDANAHVSE